MEHSLSPVFQNAALSTCGIALRYERREVAPASLEAVLAECGRTNCGGNVTMPHKRAVHDAAAVRTPVAVRTGAVNTFWWEDGRLVGHNTDVHGIGATVAALCPGGIAGDVVLLGAGGSAAAVLVALDLGPRADSSRTHVLARTPARAHELVQRVQSSARVVEQHTQVDWSRVSLVINATPSGMHTNDGPPLDLALLPSTAAVFDLVYRREGTSWVNEARARGLTAEDGLRMLVEQGAAAFECWFGRVAPRAAMWESLDVRMPSPHAPRP